MKRIIENRILFILFRIFIGFLFIYAGVEKIFDPAGFAETISNYRILPQPLINIAAVVLPWLELLTGLFLILGLFIHGSSLILLGLLVIFTIAISINVFRGIDISCGCRTPWDATDRVSVKKVIEEIILILMTLQIFLHTTRTFCVDAFRNIKN